MNHLRTYKAYSMREALDAVKQDLGADAVILSTRTLRQGGFLGLGARTVVEVTASPAEPKPRPRPRPATPKTNGARAAAAGRAYQQAAPPATGGDVAQALAAAHERQARERTPEPAPPAAAPAPSPPAPAPAPAREEADDAPAAPVARRFVLRPAEASAAETPTTEPSRVEPKPSSKSSPRDAAPTGPRRPARLFDDEPPPPPARARPAADHEMQDELAAIREMVGQVLQRQHLPGNGAPTPSMPKALFEMYLKLVGQDLSTIASRPLISSARTPTSSVCRWRS